MAQTEPMKTGGETILSRRSKNIRGEDPRSGAEALEASFPALRAGSPPQAFTLIEIVMVILLLTVLTTLSLYFVNSDTDAKRYEETRARMEAIRGAILGDVSVDKTGRRQHFGHHGDWGSLPTALDALVTAQSPAWSYNATYGFGAGWNGPYVQSSFTGSLPVTKDAWARDFVYSLVTSPPSLTSYGADGAAGGTVYNKDLTVTFESALRLATVFGIVADGDTKLASKTVEIRYPVNGLITAFTTTTDSNGSFSFTNVPFGVRSLRVTGSPVLGPQQIIVDSSPYEVPPSTLNYFGKLQEVTYVSGSAAVSGPGNSHVTATLKSSYVNTLQVNYITVSWTGVTGGYLKMVIVNGTTQDIANVPSGTRVDVSVTQTLPANSISNSLELRFSLNPDGSGNIDMENTTITVVIEWTTTADTDTVTFSPP